MRRGKLPTIQDVALRAGVSTATVSRALSSPELVSAKTRTNVVAAVRATGYAINQAARSLRSSAAHTILVVFPNVGNPFYSVVLEGLLSETAARGFGTLIADGLADHPTKWLSDYYLSSRADGMILFDTSLDVAPFYGPGGQLRFPVVIASDEVLDPRITTVRIDNRAAALAACNHLIELGHRRIGHVRAPTRTPTITSDRLLGYRDALAAAGLDYREDWVFPGDFSVEGGERAARGFLALADRPTAMFISNDEMALGFIRTCAEAGVRCPEDVSIVGFDDISVARWFSPSLTTIRQPRTELGRLAARTLLDLVEERSLTREPLQRLLPFELIVRASAVPFHEPARAVRGRARLHGAPI